MDAAFQRRTLEALDAVLDQPDAERECWMAQQHSADPELLSALRRLLDTDRQHAHALPTVVPQARGLAPELTAPDHVGVWRLAQCLGHGGMGQVYLGIRDDGVFEQKVAIKLMSPSLFPAAALQLFDNERRVLARLRHPHIAQIYDGGVTPQGLPFFAMELVEGEPLDRYCAERDLPLPAVLRLFLEACSAVSHAHQNLVVHADLKPSNIHVDASGQLKLLDFGIARLVAQGSEQTEEMPQPLTPAYASPNRQSGEAATPADDVYSLGVVLFELLTGVRPAAPCRLASEAVLAADGALPQHRLCARQLRGDLDAIIAKATAPLTGQRYASVDALADDLRRWQRTLPVHARADGWSYRARKFLVRNRIAVSLGVVAFSGLSLALAVTTSLYRRAESARTLAEQRFDDVRAMANYLLFDLDSQLDATPGNTAARRDLVERSQQYLDALTVTAGGNPELQREVAAGLTRLGEIQGGWSMPNVGEPDKARRNFERAEGMLVALLAQRQGQWQWLRDLGHVQARLADFYGGRDNDTHRQLAKAREAERKLKLALEAGAGFSFGQRAEIETLLNIAILSQAFALNWTDQPQAASVIAEREAVRLSELPEKVRQQMPFEYLSSRTAMHLGDAQYYLRQFESALASYRLGLEHVVRGLATTPTDRRLLDIAAVGYSDTSATLTELGRLPEALSEVDRGVPIATRLLDLDPENLTAQRRLSALRSVQAQILGDLARYDEAIVVAQDEQGIRAARAARSPDDAEPARDALILLAPMARWYWKSGKARAACETLQRANESWDAIDRRWGIPDLDKREIAALRGDSKAWCPGRSSSP